MWEKKQHFLTVKFQIIFVNNSLSKRWSLVPPLPPVSRGLSLMACFPKIEYKKIGKSNFLVEKLGEHDLGQGIMFNIISDKSCSLIPCIITDMK